MCGYFLNNPRMISRNLLCKGNVCIKEIKIILIEKNKCQIVNFYKLIFYFIESKTNNAKH